MTPPDLIKGETVVVEIPAPSGIDGYNATAFGQPGLQSVDNVLVVPGAPLDLNESNRPDAAKVKFTLHFPKNYQGGLEGCHILVRGERLKVVGAPAPYTEAATPGGWSMPVLGGGVHG
jgi:hypothetical protein